MIKDQNSETLMNSIILLFYQRSCVRNSSSSISNPSFNQKPKLGPFSFQRYLHKSTTRLVSLIFNETKKSTHLPRLF